MMRRFLVASLIGVAGFTLYAQTAEASTHLELPTGSTRDLYQSWIDASAVPTANATVIVHLRNCDEDAMTCMAWARGGPQVYFPDMAYLWTEPDRSAFDQTMVKSLFLHEFGHVWDYYASRRSKVREKFMRVMGLEGAWWSWRHEDAPPGEQFADAYSYCAQRVYPSQSSYEGYRAYHPTHRQHQRVCALIQAIG